MSTPPRASNVYRRRILIPMDGSHRSEQAFQWYLANLRHDGDHVTVAHIVEPPSLPSFSLKSGFQVPSDTWRDILLESGRRAKQMEEEMDARARNHRMKIEFIVESSKRPGEALVDIAHRTNTDLILMASRGQSDVRRAFMGSVSDFVLHHSRLPVCIVPCKETATATAAATTTAGSSPATKK